MLLEKESSRFSSNSKINKLCIYPRTTISNDLFPTSRNRSFDPAHIKHNNRSVVVIVFPEERNKKKKKKNSK